MVDVDRSQADGRQTIYGAAVGFRMLEARNLKGGTLMAGEVFVERVATLILRWAQE